jgi:hypothetical protein
MRWAFGLGLGLVLWWAPVAAGDAEPRVFSLLVAGANPFAPLAPDESFSDVAVRSDGRIVALPGCCGGRRLYEVDPQGRARVLRSDLYLEVDESNALIESRDGALLFSERGRVLRRAPDGTTSVFAGTPQRRRASGDGGPAVGAGMEPTGLAELPDGSVLIADARNHRVRRVDSAGVISTVAGTGMPGSDGDGGPAARARLTRPVAVSAYPDGSYLIAHGTRQVLVRRVAADGTISTVAGGGGVARALVEPCPREPRSATSLSLSPDGVGDIAALADGGFLLSDSSGLLQVSAQGTVVALTCSPLATSYPKDGREIYVAGRPLASALLGGDGYGASDVAVDTDGTIVLDSEFGLSSLALIATPGATRRLAVAITPATLSSIHHGEIVVASTAAAAVEVRAYQRKRLVARLAGHVDAGETKLDLADRLPPGINTLRVTAQTEDGRRAAHSLRVLGTASVSTRLAKWFIRDFFYWWEVGEGVGYIRLSRCRHNGPRNVRCRARGQANGRRVRAGYRIQLRRNGVVVLTLNADGRRFVTALDL